MESAQRSLSPLVGTQLGGFTIVEELATGGMGTVFLARRTGLSGFGQPVAVKVIHPHLAQDRGFVEMFVDEARIASCVHHPNVCAVLEFGKARGTFFLAMEYLQGETWAATLRALRQCPRSPGRRLESNLLLAHVVAQACEGLHAAHEATDQRGLPLCIVHRDVSPQNLFVGYDGGVRLLDFGIASAADRLHTTRFGTIKGRYSYMAPEQMLGEPVDRRSDVWSLGVVLREGLTGRSVFRGATDAETVYAVTHRLVPPWESGLHPELRRIADKAMHWEPEQRYQSAREMGMDLARFCQAAGAQIGMAELSEGMHALFPERIAQTRALLRRAANDNGATPRVPFSLPPPPRLQEELTTRSLHAPAEHADLERELTTRERFDDEEEAPTWERDPAPTRDHAPRRPTTTRELMTVSRPAPAREAGSGGSWAALALAAACVALIALGTGSLAPTRVVVTGSVKVSPTVSLHAASASALRTSQRALPEPRIEPPAEPARLPAVEFDGARSEALREGVGAASQGPATSVAPAPRDAPRPRFAPRGRRRIGPQPSQASPARSAPAAPPAPAADAVPNAPAAPGTLNIIALNGWADVYLGTRKLGTTPGRFTLPAGTQVLMLRAAGTGAPQRAVVEIQPGQVSRARVMLTP
ncbi:MAG TPA: serine/threonine-protein kinase [Polyangiales bacterium]